jgi:hypothetical protein
VTALVNGNDRKRATGLGFHEYQELKSAVHRDLITKVDLEKVATMRDARVRSQVFTVVQDLVENLNTAFAFLGATPIPRVTALHFGPLFHS